MSINKEFENYVREIFGQHLGANLELYVNGKLTAGERRVLATKWVVEAWQRVKKQKDLIKHSSKKCGLSNNLDGSEDALINIKGIEAYKMLLPKKEFQMIEETDIEDDDDDNEFEESSSESNSDSK